MGALMFFASRTRHLGHTTTSLISVEPSIDRGSKRQTPAFANVTPPVNDILNDYDPADNPVNNAWF